MCSLLLRNVWPLRLSLSNLRCDNSALHLAFNTEETQSCLVPSLKVGVPFAWQILALIVLFPKTSPSQRWQRVITRSRKSHGCENSNITCGAYKEPPPLRLHRWTLACGEGRRDATAGCDGTDLNHLSKSLVAGLSTRRGCNEC